MPGNGCSQLGKIRALALATGDKHDIALATQPAQGGLSGADIGPFGIVEPVDTVNGSDQLHTMRQTGETP